MTIKMLDIERQRAAMEPGLTESVLAVLDHGRFINGPEVAELEEQLREYVGVEHVIACANGTDALQILMRTIGAGAGDAVFVPSLTYYATAEAVSLIGATPVFVDVDLETGCMSPASLTAAVDEIVAEGKLTPRAVAPVDLFSIPADYTALRAIADKHGMKVLIDAAQSFGTETPSGRAGRFGDAAGTSFYPSKSLGGYGDGGAMFTNDPEIAKAARAMANHGVYAGQHHYIGTNSRLDSLQAAILLCKLAVFDDELVKRRSIAERYAAGMDGHVAVPVAPEGVAPCWAYYVIRSANRDALASHLELNGVPSVPYYKQAVHAQPAYDGARIAPGGLPNTDIFSAELLCLPSHPYMTDDEVAQVIEAVRSFNG
ncbi:DegT/DnrJ/EryC1/StrS family aminotransferase [Anianabacter salinae]|uniref:DegT/DnrJ/EryC1/StrS family aminotransferase n=1 Tax=Anianabacter salinae TaxID=2851023 RepID=UPI00225E173E|nr:DegT/DnrJ/EryC1/StrS family aminotransferase [Anianabacter salinae]MBV0912356.1 DegT/DnrJ/EryC1/StrS family aminotransferase [Anianabacter salinae]